MPACATGCFGGGWMRMRAIFGVGLVAGIRETTGHHWDDAADRAGNAGENAAAPASAQ